MMPSAADFGTAMRALGVDSRRHLVIYDDGTLFSAPRAWWMLRTFGAPRVSLLAGGSLPGNAWDFLCIRGSDDRLAGTLPGSAGYAPPAQRRAGADGAGG